MTVQMVFDQWFNKLTKNQKQELLKHIFDDHWMNLSEGLFAGPSGKVTKGIYAGPGPNNQGKCPLCGR